MTAVMDWEDIPEREFENYQKRLQIVELILDSSIDSETKKDLRQRFCQDNAVSQRTIHNWLTRYLKSGPASLVFCRDHHRSPRIADEQLRAKISEMVHEQPSRSVPQLRRLLNVDAPYAEKIHGISNRTLYRFLFENGMSHSQRLALLGDQAKRAFHHFEAPHSMALVQGDARDGIWLSGAGGKPRKTYLFLWLDDYSRKILFGKYYRDEKLPCMEDSFMYMVLRWGIPSKLYLDNGSVYISRHFASVLAELKIRQLHHKPYKAHAKGKVEAVQKTIKHQFQAEAQRAGFLTLEELNTAFWAWADLEYNRRIHSSTGQSPEERFLQGLPADHKRVSDLLTFQRMFLWKEKRTVSKWGKIKLYSNLYPVRSRPPGSVVQVRFTPFDLSELFIYDPPDTYQETSRPSSQKNTTAPQIPEESAKSPQQISQQSLAYFTRLRQKHLQTQKQAQEVSFQTLKDPHTEAPNA